ncbi:peptidoglycan-binding domain-containing protein, partial [Evansella tamaricis]
MFKITNLSFLLSVLICFCLINIGTSYASLETINDDDVKTQILSELELGYSELIFQLGDRHPLIIELKHKLNRIGFGNITVTDYYGDFTTRRVREFQQHY